MVKNLLILSLCIYSHNLLNAKINYTDFGSGMTIVGDANYAMDIDGDGLTDFYINGIKGELGFVPIPAKGCFTSPSEFATTSWGARELDIHNYGDFINITETNTDSYIDEDRGSAFSSVSGLAPGWSENEEVYIGFAVFADDFLTVSNGWMKVSIDVTKNTLTIKELAYTDSQPLGLQGINAGDSGLVSAVSDTKGFLPSLSIAPHPAHDFTIINFKYSVRTSLDINVYTAEGRLIDTNNIAVLPGDNSIFLDTSKWDTGLYFISFRSVQGKQTESLLVSR